ncbi:SIS domain-containing protein [Kineococcus sp. NPDC059986]|uniref:SIS domain-containing protein n=1 Tax=Kineococcus sp. NPDC059986 TaxID=3155538 RepID=UPI003450EB12
MTPRFPDGELDGLRARGAVHTATEVAQQPALWREVADLVAADDAARAWLAPLLARDDVRVVLTGAGTSAFVGLVLAPALTRLLGRPVEALATTDLVADPRGALLTDRPTLLVSFARSGDSPESVAATQVADAAVAEVHHLVVTCNAGGRLATAHTGRARSHVVTLPPATNDRGFAMTSSFTSMLLAARLLLAPAASVPVPALAEAAEAALRTADDLAAVAARGHDRVVLLGSGPLEGLAREASLKLLELTAGAVVGLHDTSLGFRHGPKSFLRPGTLAVVFRSGDPYTQRYDDDIVAELRAALGERDVLVVDPGLPDGVPDDLRALPAAVTAQLLALRFALAGPGTPDDPFPDGEVNRVVQGVTVHPWQP